MLAYHWSGRVRGLLKYLGGYAFQMAVAVTMMSVDNDSQFPVNYPHPALEPWPFYPDSGSF